MGAPLAHARQRLGAGGDDGVAAQDQVRGRRAHARGQDILLARADEHMAPGGAALLRQARRILRHHAFAFDVRSHPQQLADGDDPGTADARHHDAPGRRARAQLRQRWLGQRRQGRRIRHARIAPGLAQLAASYGDEAGAKALDAGKVLVARALVDGALAAELGLQRLHAQAVALHAAIATALADALVDHGTLVGVGHQAALAAAAFLGGAGLVIDDRGHALGVAAFALHAIKLVAVQHRHVGRQRQRHAAERGVVRARVLGGLIRHDEELAHPLAAQAVHDLQHRVPLGPLAHGLAAGHGHRVVVQDLVRDVDPGGNRLPDSQQPAVKVGAIAQVREDVLFVRERLLPHPRHALAPHLRERNRVAVHPDRHVMAANARHRARALGHPRRGVVRAARAKPGHALHVAQLRLQRLQRALTRLDDGQLRLHPGSDIAAFRQQTAPTQPLDQRARDDGRRQVGVGAQQLVGTGVGHGPFAPRVVALDLVELTQHVRAHVGTPVVELFLELVFDDLAFFFYHQDLAQALGERARDLRLQRPHHRHLVHANAELAAGIVVQPQVMQGLTQVVVGLAAGDDAVAVVRAFDDVVVEPVGTHIGQRGVPLVVHQPLFLLQRHVRPADVHPPGGQLEVVGQGDAHALGVDLDRGTGLDDLLDRLHPYPHAGIAAHGPGVQAQV